MIPVMQDEDGQVAVKLAEQGCTISDETKQMLASIHLGHREGWTFTSVKIPETWCEVDVLHGLLAFEQEDLMQGLCAEVSIRSVHVYSDRNFHVARTTERINIFETKLQVSILVVKNPLRLSELDDLNQIIDAYEDGEAVNNARISENQYFCALFERARLEGVPDEIVLKIEEDGGYDILGCLHERETYWKHAVEDNFEAPEWCSTLLWPFIDEDPFNLHKPSFSRDTAMTRSEEIRRMLE